jgi:predicted PurR-regulated permease PerM
MSPKQIARIIALLLFAAFLYLIQDVLFPIIIALFIYYLMNPLVNLLANRRPKGLGLGKTTAIIITSIVFIFIVVVLFSLIIPPFASEFNLLVQNLPQYLATAQQILDSVQQWYGGFKIPASFNAVIINSLQNLMGSMVNFTQQTASLLMGIVSQFTKLIVIPFIVFYLLKDRDQLAQGLAKYLPAEHRAKILEIIKQVNQVLNSYVSGALILCGLVGLTSGLGLYLLGVKFFLILGLIAAITEIIPLIGPFIGAVPAVIVALLTSPLLALEVVALYIVIQFLENTVFVPKVMGEKLDLHPLTVILALLVLGKLIGVWGLFFAAPIAAILKILYTELQKP